VIRVRLDYAGNIKIVKQLTTAPGKEEPQPMKKRLLSTVNVYSRNLHVYAQAKAEDAYRTFVAPALNESSHGYV